MIALIKPHFEAGRDEVEKGGVIRDPAVHERVWTEVADWLASEDWITRDRSPGRKGMSIS